MYSFLFFSQTYAAYTPTSTLLPLVYNTCPHVHSRPIEHPHSCALSFDNTQIIAVSFTFNWKTFTAHACLRSRTHVSEKSERNKQLLRNTQHSKTEHSNPHRVSGSGLQVARCTQFQPIFVSISLKRIRLTDSF